MPRGFPGTRLPYAAGLQGGVACWGALPLVRLEPHRYVSSCLPRKYFYLLTPSVPSVCFPPACDPRRDTIARPTPDVPDIASMLRGLFRRHVGMAATFAAAGALASCDSAPPVGLAEKRQSTVVHRPGSGVHTSSPLTLEYFALRGLGELPRLILEVTGLPYDCVFHYLQGDWKSRAAFGQLPLLHDGEMTISQSRAIVRYLARKACIDGATDAEKARVDMWCEFQRDLNDKKSAVRFLHLRGPHSAPRPAPRAPRLAPRASRQVHDMAAHADAPKLKQMLDAAERQLADGDGIHFVSHSLTVADVLIFSTLHQAEDRPIACAWVVRHLALRGR